MCQEFDISTHSDGAHDKLDFRIEPMASLISSSAAMMNNNTMLMHYIEPSRSTAISFSSTLWIWLAITPK